MKNVVAMMLFLLLPALLYAQDPMVGIPVKLSLVLGAGPSSATGVLGDRDDAGWNAAANVRVQGLIPLQIVGLVQYNRLPNKAPAAGPVKSVLSQSSSGASDVAWLFGAGLEYPIDLPIIRPYLVGDGFVTSLSNTAPNASSVTRQGIDFGIGAQLPFAIFDEVNVSVKYQIFNVAGKENNEDAYTQVMANIALTFDLL